MPMMLSQGHPHLHVFRKIRFKMSCLILLKLILIVLVHVCTSCNTMSLPIDGKETGPQLNRYMNETFLRSGRTLLQANDFFDECEFGTTWQPYDETCANGATNLLPCNPGQLKVAECIGQDGDTSRVCDPCPQKFYQSFYNKCTRCHQCSECGPNEEISELCTEKKDTVCRSIIPSQHVTATSPKPDTTPLSQPPTPSTTTTTISSSPTTQQSVVSTVSPHVVDQTIDTTTAENEKPTPPGPAYQDTCVGFTILAVPSCIFMVVLLIIVIILSYKCSKQRKEIKDLRGTCRLELAERLSGPRVSSSSSGEQSGVHDPESSVGHRESSPMTDGVVHVYCPNDVKKPRVSKDVVKDSIKTKLKKKGKAPCVTFHKDQSGSGPSQSDEIKCKSSPPHQKTNLEKNKSSDNGGSVSAHESTPPVNRRADVESDLCNEKVPGSTHTAEVHCDPGNLHIPGDRGPEDGDSQSSYSRDTNHPDSGDPNDPASRPGQGDNPATWHAEKVPGSTALPSMSSDENESSTEMPDFIDNYSGTRDPGTVTDAPPEEPITLPSSARNTQAPIAGEEEYEEAIGPNTNETNAATADTEDDVLQRLMEPEATAGNNNEGNTTVPTDTETSEDEDGDRKPWTQRALQLVTRLRRNNNKKERKNNQERRKEPTRQRQQLVTMDLMVEESHLDNVAHRLKLSTLNKLCRELGLKDTEVENYKYEIKSDQITGAELVFKMLVKVRGSQGENFTYRKLAKALRASNNVHIADGMVSEFQL